MADPNQTAGGFLLQKLGDFVSQAPAAVARTYAPLNVPVASVAPNQAVGAAPAAAPAPASVPGSVVFAPPALNPTHPAVHVAGGNIPVDHPINQMVSGAMGIPAHGSTPGAPPPAMSKADFIKYGMQLSPAQYRSLLSLLPPVLSPAQQVTNTLTGLARQNFNAALQGQQPNEKYKSALEQYVRALQATLPGVAP